MTQIDEICADQKTIGARTKAPFLRSALDYSPAFETHTRLRSADLQRAMVGTTPGQPAVIASSIPRDAGQRRRRGFDSLVFLDTNLANSRHPLSHGVYPRG
jgi:hypothetical protein